MTEVGSIEAVLKLNATQFKDTLSNISEDVERFSNSLRRLNATNVESGLGKLNLILESLGKSIGKLSNISSTISVFKNMGLALNNTATSMKKFYDLSKLSEKESQQLSKFIETLKNNLLELFRELQQVATGESELGKSFGELITLAGNLKSALDNVKSELTTIKTDFENLHSSVDKSKSSINSMDKEVDASKGHFQQLNSQLNSVNRKLTETAKNTKKVGDSFKPLWYALREKFSLAFDRVTQSIYNGITETYKAKSEMNSWLDMLGLTTKQTDSFNQALDDTVKKFQRVNKYKMGETIASIGMEFELSEKEMEKALDVTSMITNEYLRAGRNSDEASLAVKDILQGQFQRLSRETGVKEETLINAGWSGDDTDTIGLLDALRKVAEDRNWDVIAQKATSVTDIFTIGQNKLEVWSADIIDKYTPMLTSVFNMVMAGFDTIAPYFEGFNNWVLSDGWGQLALKIGAISSALLVGGNALVSYRTGVTALQLAHRGFLSTLTATILGLNGETVAEYGSRNAILSKITGLKAETVATVGAKNAILSKIYGIDAETIKTKGLVTAIHESITAKEAETIEEEVNTISKEENALASFELSLEEQKEQIQRRRSLMLISEETAEEELNAIAKIEEAGATDVATTSTLGLSGAVEILSATFYASPVGWFALAILGLASAFYVLTGGLDSSWDKMKQFKEMMTDTKSAMEPHYEYLEKLKKKVGEVDDKYTSAKESVDEFYESLQSSKKVYDDAETQYGNINIGIKDNTKQIMKDHGYSKKQIHDFTSGLDAMSLGKEKYYKAEQVINKQIFDENSNYSKDLDKLLTNLDTANVGLKDKLDQQEKLAGNYEELAKNSYIVNTSDNWFDKIFHQFYAGINQFWIDWDEGIAEFQAKFKEKGLVGIIKDALFSGDESESDSSDIFDNIYSILGIDRDKVGEQIISGIEKIDWKSVLKDASIALYNGIKSALFGDEGGDPITSEEVDDWLDVFKKVIKKSWDDFWSFDWLFNESSDTGGNNSTGGASRGVVAKQIDIMGLMKNLFNFDGLDIKSMIADFINEHVPKIDLGGVWNAIVNAIFGTPVSASDVDNSTPIKIDDAIAVDPNDMPKGSWDGTGSKNIWQALLDSIFGSGDSILDSVNEWVTNTISSLVGFDISGLIEGFKSVFITPIKEYIDGFIADPIGTLATMPLDYSTFLGSLFGFNEENSVGVWVHDNIISPIGTALYNGLLQIPIIGDLVNLFGLVTDENIGTSEKGRVIADWIGRGLTNEISQIPIVGDIARMLGLIPNEYDDAHGKGKGVGENIKKGEADGHKGIADNVRTEMGNIMSAISGKAREIYNTAHNIGSQILDGIRNALDMHSPSIISRELIADEFGVYIPESISSSADTVYGVAQEYGRRIRDGVQSSADTTIGLDSVVGSYQDDAQTIASSSQLMGNTTTTAFNNMQSQVNSSMMNMSSNVSSSYTSMQAKQASLLNTMKSKNTTAYNEMYNHSNQSLLQMRDSTSNVTNQMTHAWSHMKDNIVKSANQLKTESTSHFNTLSSTIGSFYRKIQNPSNWGAGSPSYSHHAPKPRVGRKLVGAGTNKSSSPYYNTNKVMTLRDLRSMIGGANLFTGLNMSNRVNVADFLAIFGADGGFGWNNWHTKHYNHIKSTSDKWNMKAPIIMGKIQSNRGFTVGEFEGGKPSLSFDDFQATAEAIFNEIPYKFYYNSDWKGSWVEALKAGAVNCNDGAEALIALAQTYGFDGHKEHTTLKNGVGHFYAVINGKTMDTTSFQNRGSWSKLGAGIPTRTSHSSRSVDVGETQTVNVNISMDNSTFYGVDDLEERIENGVDKGLQKHFNNPYTVPI